MHLLYGLLRNEATVHSGAAGRRAVHVIDQLVERLRDSRMMTSTSPLCQACMALLMPWIRSAHRQLRVRRVQSSRTYCSAHIAARRHSVVVSQERRHSSHVMDAEPPCARCWDQSRASAVLQDVKGATDLRQDVLLR